MDCTRIRRWILEGGDPASPEAQRHLAECPACMSLYAGGADLARLLAGAQAAEPRPAEPDLAGLERQLAGERGWRARLTELPSRSRWAWAVTMLLLPVVVGSIRHRDNLALYPLGRLVAELGLFAGLVAASCWLWLRPLYQRQPSHRVLLAALLLALALPWALAMLPPALPTAILAAQAAARSDVQRAASCFLFGAMTAMPALVVVAGLGRRRAGFPGFVLLPATAAALAGLLGLELHCPETAPAHLLMGHAPIAVALPLLLLLISLRRRARPRVRPT